MTQEQLDNIGFALVVARVAFIQQESALRAMGYVDVAEEFKAQAIRFEAVQACIANGSIAATETTQ